MIAIWVLIICVLLPAMIWGPMTMWLTLPLVLIFGFIIGDQL